MASKKEDERNEKIIRGLLKLPPNRRCINCNSLGPQYVCTSFWTFVCTTCSGIHREFTHRVKSVSMAKFTSQEVEALQNGGNQRAREIYLKDWDLQRHRLPSNSNVDKVREFIVNVYVDKKYVGGKTSEKPPIDAQSLRSHEKETRRASSYHSFSQSPPYDYQYEDRRYGKQAPVLTRKPGSDRGLYDGNSRLVYSPGHLSDHMYEDQFSNEGSVSRVSDYSTSSGVDPFRSGPQSPNFQKGIGFSSPPIQPSIANSSEDAQRQTMYTYSDANAKRNADGIPRPQRSASSGSFGSFDSNSMSLKSFNSGGLMDVVSELEQVAAIHPDKLSTLTHPPVAGSSGNIDLFKAPVLPEAVTAASSSNDLFQLPGTSSAPSVNLFKPSSIAPASSVNVYQPPENLSPTLDFFSQQQSAAIWDEKSPELSVPQNEGWATFDSPQPAASIPSTEKFFPATIPFDNGEPFSSLTTSIRWLEDLHSLQASTVANHSQSWNAFEDSVSDLPLEGITQSSEPEGLAHNISSTADHNLSSKTPEDPSNDGIRRDESHAGLSGQSASSHVVGQSFAPSMLHFMGETQSHAIDCKSTNPFDLPYDSELEQSNMFLDLNSLQAALPNAQLSSPFLGDVSQPWFPPNPLTAYIPAAQQGNLSLMAGQSASSQMANIKAQGSVASIGGNPFA